MEIMWDILENTEHSQGTYPLLVDLISNQIQKCKLCYSHRSFRNMSLCYAQAIIMSTFVWRNILIICQIACMW